MTVDNPEQYLVLELEAAVCGDPMPSRIHEEVGDLVTCLTSGGSGNWNLLGWSTRYLLGDTDAPGQCYGRLSP